MPQKNPVEIQLRERFGEEELGEERFQTTNVRLPHDLHRRLRITALWNDISMNAAIIQGVKMWLDSSDDNDVNRTEPTRKKTRSERVNKKPMLVQDFSQKVKREKWHSKRKVFMEPQGRELIQQVQAKYPLTQKDLEKIFRDDGIDITQQTVSNYKAGSVAKERHDVIQKLKDLRDGKIDETTQRILEDKGMNRT